jgi:YHS domain-containing protein
MRLQRCILYSGAYVHDSLAARGGNMKHKATGQTVTDPVCGMQIEPLQAAATRTHEGVTFYFCSQGCAKEFDADPHRFAHRDK